VNQRIDLFTMQRVPQRLLASASLPWRSIYLSFRQNRSSLVLKFGGKRRAFAHFAHTLHCAVRLPTSTL